MCLNPLHIKTKSKYINAQTLHKVDMEVPCGKCAECLAAKRNEYYFRSYYQAQDCWSHGGYCLFDTLTYNDEHLPHVNDFLEESGFDFRFSDSDNFSCFNARDIRLFLVRLRRQLAYHGFNPKEKLKYFVCSEYGEDPRYTHRPHYHVMFYVYDSTLDPVYLSNMIDKCWQNGITDGAPYQGASYVLQKRVFYKGSDDIHMQSVCSYIGKYMTKDSEFTATVNERFDNLLSQLYSNEQLQRPYFKQKVKEVRRHISQFIRNSQGFGLYMIEALGKDWIFENGCVQMPDQEHVVKQIPIPAYIQTHLFKEKKVDIHGDVYYSWSDYGNEYRMYHMEKRLTDLTNKFKNHFTYETYLGIGMDYGDIKAILDTVDKCLDGRTFEDLAYYQTYQKGRLYVPEGDEEPDYESYYYIDQHEFYGDFSIFHDDFFDENLRNKTKHVIDVQDSVMKLGKYVMKDDGFDWILNIYAHNVRVLSAAKQKAFDEREAQQRVWKKLGLKYKKK